jgi:hypothetical protein
MGFKQPNNDMFKLLVGGQKINNHCKNIISFFQHPNIENACG